ncbi:hypothetical protein GJ700_17750 [Duganella sp. FT92W]|uniref:Uncharacterized protein n=1 Tax=Pseudoduganella rivuli TaxID=2666085 RepID=A0A7X2LSI5_9BURK|nr:hypothetical protein [Pseudoduganella rivuli]MRV73560.1 hypothetical protein [Pseudoduganella rivuli]
MGQDNMHTSWKSAGFHNKKVLDDAAQCRCGATPNFLRIAENERLQMTDFATQDTAVIAATVAPTVDANTIEPTVKTHVPSIQIVDAIAAPPQLENQPRQPLSDVVKSKQEERRDLFALVDTIRCFVESHCAEAANKSYSEIYNGTFDVRFDSPDEVTPKTINALLSKGVVFFFPCNINQYPWLKKYCKQDGGINLSALCTRKNRPANINDTDWTSLMSMWAAVSTVLHVKGIDPIYAVFTEALRSFGHGGPKINRKLGGDLAAMQGNQAPMQDVLKKLISLLEVLPND